MKIGELLKEYRITQLKKQKDFAGTVISPSYYSKVEKNINRITAEDLVELLHYNNIPLWDFFGKLNQDDNLQESMLKEIKKQMLDIYYSARSNDFNATEKRFKAIKAFIKESVLSETEKEEQCLIVDGWIESIKGDAVSHNDGIRQKLKEKIFNIPTFDQNKLILFCDFMPFYDLASNKLIAKQIIRQYQNSSDVEVQRAILAILANLLAMAINEQNFTGINEFVQAADQIPGKPELFFYKNGILFFKSLIGYQQGDKKAIEKCQIAVDNLTLLGMPEYGKRLENFLEKHI